MVHTICRLPHNIQHKENTGQYTNEWLHEKMPCSIFLPLTDIFLSDIIKSELSLFEVTLREISMKLVFLIGLPGAFKTNVK